MNDPYTSYLSQSLITVLTLSSLRDRLSVARIVFFKLEPMVLSCCVYSSSGIIMFIPVEIQFLRSSLCTS
jgi:hypothetical protein